MGGAHLRPLVGLGRRRGAGDRAGEAFAAWRRFFEAIAERRPLVLVFEDLHWADDGLLDFVDQSRRPVAGVPLLVVCTARPELLERRPGWGGGSGTPYRLLDAADDDDGAPDRRASRPPRAPGGDAGRAPPAGRRESAVRRGVRADARRPRRAAGLASGDGAGHCRGPPRPPLRDAEKALLQDAAVLGKVFWTDALAALGSRASGARGATPRARAEGVHLPRAAVGRRRRAQYAFRHVLVRDVAYGQMPRAARADGHRRPSGSSRFLSTARRTARRCLPTTTRPRSSTRRAPASIGELVARASAALREAGDRAIALNAFAAAAGTSSSALELGELDAKRLLAYGRALWLSEARGDDVSKAAAEASAGEGGRRDRGGGRDAERRARLLPGNATCRVSSCRATRPLRS